MKDRPELLSRRGELLRQITRLAALGICAEESEQFDNASLSAQVSGVAEDITAVWTGLTAPERDRLTALLAEYCGLEEQLNGPLDREGMRQARARYLKQIEDPPPGD
jgi:hypothetical protein